MSMQNQKLALFGFVSQDSELSEFSLFLISAPG